jgi:hypothetical protein
MAKANSTQNTQGINNLLEIIPQFVNDLEEIRDNKNLFNDDEHNALVPFMTSWIQHTRSLLEDRCISD